jgi:tetratricopeptide (TPR) repeat protein
MLWLFGITLFGYTLPVGCSGPPQVPPMTGAQRYNAEGLRQLERGELASADLMFHDALKEAELIDDLQGQAEAWNNLGALAMAHGDASQAYAHHWRALQLYATRGTRDVGEIRTRTNLGVALLAQKQFPRAKEQFEEAIHLAGVLKQQDRSLLAASGLTLLHLQEGLIDQALQEAQSLISRAEKAHDQEVLASGWATLAAIYQAKKDIPQAEKAIQKALVLDREREAPVAVANDLLALASLYQQNKEWEQAAMTLARCSRVERRLGLFAQAEQHLRTAINQGKGHLPVATQQLLESELDAVMQAREQLKSR